MSRKTRHGNKILLISIVLCLVLYPLGRVLDLDERRLSLAYGYAAAGFLILAAAWMLRRRAMGTATRLRLGSSKTWLQLHVLAGTLFLLLVFMHTHFRLPHGTFSWCLWTLCLWTTLTGWAGLLLQRWIPKALANGLATEVIYERIPQLCAELETRANGLVNGAEEALKTFHGRNVAPLLAAPKAGAIYFIDITGGRQRHLNRFAYVRPFLNEADRIRLDNLQQLLGTKLEMDAHYTLQRATRWWLYLHVPPSILLLALVGLHLFAVFYF